MSEPRYAIYFAPAPHTQLWSLGSRWLGRDAKTGETLARPEPIQPDNGGQLTSSPRRYGFHATLKPPMRLRTGTTIGQLCVKLAAWAQRQSPFSVRLKCAALGKFIALVPETTADSTRMSSLAADCVELLDEFRQPPTHDELARRRSAGLSHRQDEMLVRYGYPYVMSEFRFHMTLSNAIADEVLRTQFWNKASLWFAEVLSEPVPVNQVAIYNENESGGNFSWFKTFALGG